MKWLARISSLALLVAPAGLGCASLPDLPPYSETIPAARSTSPPPPSVLPPSCLEHASAGGPVISPTLHSESFEIDIHRNPLGPSAAPAPMTLEYFEALAEQVHPALRRDRAQIESARGSAVQAGVLPNPQFNANNPWVFNGRNSLLNAGVQQEIPVMGKKRLDEAAANEVIRQTEFVYFQNRAAVLAAVRQQFYTVLVDQQRIKVLTRLLETVRKSHEAAVKKKQAGEATETDVLLLKIDVDRTEAALRSAEAILQGDRKQLEALVGAPGSVRGDVQGQLTGAYPVFDEQMILDYVTKNHTQVKAAQSVVQQNRLLLRRARVEPYPNPTLGPAYQFGLVPGNDQFWFNMSFAIPVWDQNQGNIRAAEANVAVATETVDTTRLILVNQASNLLSQFIAAKRVVERFEGGILANANEAARLAQNGYARGVVDLGTFLQAQRTAIQANSDYIDALQNLWLNATQLSGLLQLDRFP
jgi:cobalt-zinc-cadmium efflux system outer membrane protein